MHLTNLDVILWLAGFVGHILLLVVLLLRKQAQRFPWFTSFVVVSIVRTIALWLVRNDRTQYFDMYWSLYVLDAALQLAVVYEIAGSVFRPVGVWAEDVRKKVIGYIVAGLAIAGLVTTQAHPPVKYLYQSVVIRAEVFNGILMIELFAILLVVSSNAGLMWRHYVRHIANGFALYSVANVIVGIGHNISGSKPDVFSLLSQSRSIVYCVCLIYWIAAFLLPEPPRRKITPEIRAKLFALGRKLEYDLSNDRSDHSQ